MLLLKIYVYTGKVLGKICCKLSKYNNAHVKLEYYKQTPMPHCLEISVLDPNNLCLDTDPGSQVHSDP